jgi:hypothetical protein
VSDVARVQSVTARVALDALIDDSLASEAARGAGLIDLAAIKIACEAALARSQIAHIVAEARRKGPPDDEELSTLDVVHALVPRGGTVSDRAKIALAQAIRQEVERAVSVEDFERLANAVPHAGIVTRVEQVTGFGADGKAKDGSEIDASFVAAAFGLRSIGATSPVVETPFGWHVLRLIARARPESASLDDRRDALAEAVVSMRAREGLQELLLRRRQTTEVLVSPDADELTALVATAAPP